MRILTFIFAVLLSIPAFAADKSFKAEWVTATDTDSIQITWRKNGASVATATLAAAATEHTQVISVNDGDQISYFLQFTNATGSTGATSPTITATAPAAPPTPTGLTLVQLN